MLRRSSDRPASQPEKGQLARSMRRRVDVGGMVLLAIGHSAYKLNRRDVARIEQQTGQKAEDLSDGQIEKVTSQLSIALAPVTAADLAQLEAAEKAATRKAP